MDGVYEVMRRSGYRVEARGADGSILNPVCLVGRPCDVEEGPPWLVARCVLGLALAMARCPWACLAPSEMSPVFGRNCIRSCPGTPEAPPPAAAEPIAGPVITVDSGSEGGPEGGQVSSVAAADAQALAQDPDPDCGNAETIAVITKKLSALSRAELLRLAVQQQCEPQQLRGVRNEEKEKCIRLSDAAANATRS